MDRRVTPPKRATSPTWGPPPPCKQALKGHDEVDHLAFDWCFFGQFKLTEIWIYRLLKRAFSRNIFLAFFGTFYIFGIFFFL